VLEAQVAELNYELCFEQMRRRHYRSPAWIEARLAKARESLEHLLKGDPGGLHYSPQDQGRARRRPMTMPIAAVNTTRAGDDRAVRSPTSGARAF
jgi:hypothetical protein